MTMGEKAACGSSVEHHHTCGWCPTLLSCDHQDWYIHHFVNHGTLGYSVRDHSGPADWDGALAGLTEPLRAESTDHSGRSQEADQ